MAEYYFISQLPSLDGIGETMQVPITEERFLELCDRYLGKKAQGELKKLTLIPSQAPEKSGSELINAWNEQERNLRFALGKVRAEKMKKSLSWEGKQLPAELIRAASVAAQMDNPLEAEKFLSDYRLGVLESLRPMDPFSEEYIFYYWLKLKLILRMRRFDAKLGETAYKNIYSSIINGDRLEAI